MFTCPSVSKATGAMTPRRWGSCLRYSNVAGWVGCEPCEAHGMLVEAADEGAGVCPATRWLKVENPAEHGRHPADEARPDRQSLAGGSSTPTRRARGLGAEALVDALSGPSAVASAAPH